MRLGAAPEKRLRDAHQVVASIATAPGTATRAVAEEVLVGGDEVGHGGEPLLPEAPVGDGERHAAVAVLLEQDLLALPRHQAPVAVPVLHHFADKVGVVAARLVLGELGYLALHLAGAVVKVAHDLGGGGVVDAVHAAQAALTLMHREHGGRVDEAHLQPHLFVVGVEAVKADQHAVLLDGVGKRHFEMGKPAAAELPRLHLKQVRREVLLCRRFLLVDGVAEERLNVPVHAAHVGADKVVFVAQGGGVEALDLAALHAFAVALEHAVGFEIETAHHLAGEQHPSLVVVLLPVGFV